MKMTEFSKFFSINIGLLIIVLILNTVSSQDVTLIAAEKDASSARSLFSLPKLFNFERFKGIFNKTYGSVLENLVRKRLYLGRTFRAFITAVGYKHCRINYYLGINQMSDWTLEEQKATLMSSSFFINDNSSDFDKDKDEDDDDDNDSSGIIDNHQQTENELPVADLEDIKEKFEEIADHENEKPGYREILKELKDIQRFKRDVDDIRENFSVKDLIKVFEGASSTQKVGTGKLEEPDKTQRESSPVEEPKPVIVSPPQDQQVSVKKEAENLPVKEAEIIAKQPDGPFLKTVISVATSMFSKQKSGKESEKRQDKVYHDYRRSKCYLPLKDQKGCACCYAFAAIAMYEWVYCSETGKPLAFSEQYPIDCGQDVGLDGCNAAKYDTLSNFTVKYGLESLNNYPYIGKDGRCPYNKEETLPEAMGYLRFIDEGWFHVPIKKFEDQLKRTPIVVNMLVTDKIHEYGGGVDDGSYCDQDYKHSALLIGSGRENGEEYWLFRFAYTDAYGEGGHYKLNKESKCLARCGSVLKANFGKSPDESLNLKYYSKPVEELKREYLP